MKAFFSLFAQQIASAVVDAPFSGFLVNQNIEEANDVLAWETERATVNAGTYSLSMPSGLASNRQSLLFVSATNECTLTLTTRDYGDSVDQVLVCTVTTAEPFYAVLHNIKSASITATQSTSFQSFVAKVSPVVTTSQTNPNQGLDYGSLPIGGVVAISGAFTTPGAGYSETGIVPLPSYLQFCDGSVVNDPESIFFGKFLPNLTGSKIIYGSANAGTDSSLAATEYFMTGFGNVYNIFQAVDASQSYSVKYYMRTK